MQPVRSNDQTSDKLGESKLSHSTFHRLLERANTSRRSAQTACRSSLPLRAQSDRTTLDSERPPTHLCPARLARRLRRSRPGNRWPLEKADVCESILTELALVGPGADTGTQGDGFFATVTTVVSDCGGRHLRRRPRQTWIRPASWDGPIANRLVGS
jgi:hypothetical protein